MLRKTVAIPEAMESWIRARIDSGRYVNDYSFIASGLMRYEHKSHSVYYRVMSGSDLLIVRVPGKRQDTARYI